MFKPLSANRFVTPQSEFVPGPAPFLEWIETDKLVVDASYQREIGRRGTINVNQIAENFDWSKFAPVIVAPVEGGQFAMLHQILNERVAVQINGERKKLRKHELLIRGIVNRAVNGEVRASKQALDLMKEYGLLKLEDIQHHVVVELVGAKEPGKSEPESKAKPRQPVLIPPLGSKKR